MAPTDAVVLDNFFPSEGRVDLRRGFASHATGVGAGNVDTIAEYHSWSTRRLIAAGGGAIYNATSAGAASSLGSSFSNNRWQWVNFNGLMALVNGADTPQQYDGTTLSSLTITGSGLTSSTLIGVNAFKNRTYWWADNVQDFWYSDVNGFGGSVTKFPLSRVGTFGGKLMQMVTWSRDGGDKGSDDLAVFLMSSGEAIVYQGSDPGDAANWAIVGVFKIGSPLAIRGAIKFGADVLVITQGGYEQLSRALVEGESKAPAFSDKISRAVREATANFKSNYGWQPILYPGGSMLLFNVPVSTTTYEQHVINTQTGAWCRFTGMNGSAWGLYNDDLYFGGTGDGKVYKADTGKSDNGGDISGDAQDAYWYMGNPGVRKRVTGVMPMIEGSGDLTFSIITQPDFQTISLNDNIYTLANLGLVGNDNWEDVDVNWEDWEDAYLATSRIARRWLSANSEGFAINTRLKVKTQEAVRWYSTNYLAEPGGPV